jgi:predicted amidophosphoribosyltransferase
MDSIEKEPDCPRCGGEMSSEHAYCRLCGTPREQIISSYSKPDSWTCMTCGQKVPMEFGFCSNCGRPSIIPYGSYYYPSQPTAYPENSALIHFILYAFSFLVPLLGFVLGFLLTRSENSPDDRRAGRICIMLALFWPLITILFFFVILVIV